MAAPSPEPLTKVTIRLYERDVLYLQARYAGESYNVALRELVAAFCARSRTKAATDSNG